MNRNYIMKKKQKFNNPVTSEEGKPITENLLTNKSFLNSFPSKHLKDYQECQSSNIQTSEEKGSLPNTP